LEEHLSLRSAGSTKAAASSSGTFRTVEMGTCRSDGISYALGVATAFPIHQMSRLEKLSAMEALWEDLSRDEKALESPAWHEDALRVTERRVAASEEKPLDWEAAKKELRQRFQ
jgi:Putative addiction module component